MSDSETNSGGKRRKMTGEETEEKVTEEECNGEERRKKREKKKRRDRKAMKDGNDKKGREEKKGRKGKKEKEEKAEKEEQSEPEVTYTSLSDAIVSNASLATIERLLPEKEADKEALVHAVDREAEIFQAVLDATSKEAILLSKEGKDALHAALESGNKVAVMAVAARMEWEKEQRKSGGEGTPREEKKEEKERREEKEKEEEKTEKQREKEAKARLKRLRGCAWNPFAAKPPSKSRLLALFAGPLAGDREVFDMVTGLCKEDFDRKDIDLLSAALLSRHTDEHAVELCLKNGPSMEKRLARSVDQLFYVTAAAERWDVRMVEKMHDRVPTGSLAEARREMEYAVRSHVKRKKDGWGNKAERKELSYELPMAAAARNEEHAEEILEYLARVGGGYVLDMCEDNFFRRKSNLGMRWLEGNAEELRNNRWAAGRAAQCLFLANKGRGYVYRYFVLQLEPELITKVACELAEGNFLNGHYSEDTVAYWHKYRQILDYVPEEFFEREGFHFLSRAVYNEQYEDLAYLLDRCTHGQLGWPVDKNGDTLADVAAKKRNFPKELLARMRPTMTKRAE